MKYAVLFAVLGVALIGVGAGHGLPGLLLIWTGAAFLIVAAGYAGVGPAVFGKQPDGRLQPGRRLLLLPYLLLIELLWHGQRLFQRAPGSHEVAPGVWLGRRPLAGELPAGVRLVVDLTCEFPRGALLEGAEYCSLPCLDAAAPDPAAFAATVNRASQAEGVYIHCALGHGRSATLAAAVLVARRIAASAEEAERMLTRIRPGVGLCPAQRRLLADYCRRREHAIMGAETGAPR